MLKKLGSQIARDLVYYACSVITNYAMRKAVDYIKEQRIKRTYVTIELKN